MLSGCTRQQHVGRCEHRLGAVGPFDLLVERIGKLRADAGAALDQHPGPGRGQFVSDLGDQTDARFPRRALAKRRQS